MAGGRELRINAITIQCFYVPVFAPHAELKGLPVERKVFHKIKTVEYTIFKLDSGAVLNIRITKMELQRVTAEDDIEGLPMTQSALEILREQLAKAVRCLPWN